MEKFPHSWHSINLVIELLVTVDEVILVEELGCVESNPLIVEKGSNVAGHKLFSI